MTNPSITAHMVVKNEDQWVGFAIQSVLPYVQRFLITDTGSTDRTAEIIKSIKDEKIEFRQTIAKTPQEIIQVRNEQLKLTKTNWLWMVDGDEIYPQKTAAEIVKSLDSSYAGIVVRRYDCLGDVYHYQPDESVGAYQLAGRVGHYNLRLVNCAIPGLHLAGDYPLEGFYDEHRSAIIDYPAQKFYVTKNHYLHTTYLVRSSLGGNLSDTHHRHKYKVEWGRVLPKHELPEVFSSSPPIARSLTYNIQAAVITPFKMMKRTISR